jgi:hypothetical protein
VRGIAFIAVELVFLALAHLLGGPWWTVLGGVACVVQLSGGLAASTLAPFFPALAWALASWATGNRELYFPYAMHLAAATLTTAAPRSRPWIATIGLAVPAAFLVIRWLQAATPKVLAVETVATGVVVAVVLGLSSWRPDPLGRWWIPVAAALLAYGCLAV